MSELEGNGHDAEVDEIAIKEAIKADMREFQIHQ